ncbi:MAG TPA: hypothetical protein IAB39_08030 [Candidatus Onthovicinus excrementipullorum]|nr:hypothetical protein [Candidatus Onthovicinus excrementipullorum]
MGIVDALKALCKKITTVDSTAGTVAEAINDLDKNWPESAQGPAGPQGAPGVGIKTITGSIDGSNKLTLKITLTDDSVQTVEGTITPPAAG